MNEYNILYGASSFDFGELIIFYYFFFFHAITDNALLTQSRFVLMEPILIFFSMVGFLFLLKFDKHSRLHISNDVGYEMTNKMAAWLYACLAAIFFTLAICTKFVGIYSAALAIGIVCQQFWKHLTDTTLANMWIVIRGVSRCLVFGLIPFFIYVSIFWIHLALLHRAGPHDMVMTSAFQVMYISNITIQYNDQECIQFPDFKYQLLLYCWSIGFSGWWPCIDYQESAVGRFAWITNNTASYTWSHVLAAFACARLSSTISGQTRLQPSTTSNLLQFQRRQQLVDCEACRCK